MEEKYIMIMLDSLQKKSGVLSDIIKKNGEQSQILKEEETDWDAFDRNADEKMELIERIDELDEGFDQLFEKVKMLLESQEGKDRYGEQIRRMQQLIREITDKSTSIQATESRNKKLVEQRFQQSRQKIGQSRNSSRIVRDYYRNMQQTQVVPPAFLDNKK